MSDQSHDQDSAGEETSAALFEKILTRNSDLLERARGNLHVDYDQEWDMLSLTIGEDHGAVSLSIDNTLHIRFDSDTLMIIAFELDSFSTLLPETSPLLRLCFDLMQVCGPVTVSFSPREAVSPMNIEQQLRDLISVCEAG